MVKPPVWVVALLLAGLAIRLGILWQTRDLGTPIVDEQHYRRIATHLVLDGQFAIERGELTSLRPPLYPAMVAAVWTVAGVDNLQVIRAMQIGMTALTALLVYLLGTRLYNRRIGLLAATLFWIYPAFVFFDFLILTETLYTLLLVLFVLLAVTLIQQESPTVWMALACGGALGLACLTRSVLWPLPVLLCPLLFFFSRGTSRRRFAIAALVLAGYVGVMTPWAIRNTRLQRVVTIVDSMGGMNLRMGNYEFTPDDRMWDAVALAGERNWAAALKEERPGGGLTEGEKEKWAQQKALEYIKAHPGITARRALIKFADFWGLEREFIAGVQQGVYHPPAAAAWLAAGAILIAYVLLVLLGVAGAWIARPVDWKAQAMLLLPIVAITGAHTLVFGHSRYHVPLMPLLAVTAAALLEQGRQALARSTPAARLGAALGATLLVTIWLRQVVFSDLDRIRALF